MKAVSCAAPGVLTLVDIDRPALQSGWVRVTIRHIGICGTDREEAAGGRADAPHGQTDLVIGHEMFGQREKHANAQSVEVGFAVIGLWRDFRLVLKLTVKLHRSNSIGFQMEANLAESFAGMHLCIELFDFTRNC